MPTIASLPASSNCALNLFSPGKSQSHLRNPSHLLHISTLRLGFRLWVNETAINRRMCGGIIHSTMDDNQQSKSAQSKKPNFPVWFNWIFGWIFTPILPLAHLKGGDLQRLGGPLGQVEKVVETLEEVAEVAEEVAEVVEKVSSEVAENVPDDSMLKKTALVVEQASELVEKDAKLIMEFMQKENQPEMVEEVGEVAEEVAEVVEEVAEVVDKVSSKVAESVPDDSMLKKTALVVEQASQLVEKDAKLMMDFMQKVDEIKGQVEEVVETTLDVKAVAGEEARKA